VYYVVYNPDYETNAWTFEIMQFEYLSMYVNKAAVYYQLPEIGLGVDADEGSFRKAGTEVNFTGTTEMESSLTQMGCIQQETDKA